MYHVPWSLLGLWVKLKKKDDYSCFWWSKELVKHKAIYNAVGNCGLLDWTLSESREMKVWWRLAGQTFMVEAYLELGLDNGQA